MEQLNADDFNKKMDSIHQENLKVFGEFKDAVRQELNEVKTKGFAPPELKEKIERLEQRLDQFKAQIEHAEAARPEEPKNIGKLVTDHEKYQEAKRLMWRKNDRVMIELGDSAFPMGTKATITSTGLGTGTAGISMPQLITPTPLMIARQELRLRNIMRVRQQNEGYAFYFVRQSTRTNAPSPQVEAGLKAESTYAWDTVSDQVRTIAHYAKVSRQALDDIPWMQSTIGGELLYGLLVKEEAEILSGTGTGEHLNGLITQATAYATGTYNVSGDTKLDKLRHMKLQARLAGLATFAPDGIVLNPRDMHDIELIKDEDGGTNKGVYVVGDPRQGTAIKFVWGLPVVESDSITYGQALVGAFGTAATLVDRMAATVDISYENEDDFIRNKCTVRAEERIGLAVERPTAFIYGAL